MVVRLSQLLFPKRHSVICHSAKCLCDECRGAILPNRSFNVAMLELA